MNMFAKNDATTVEEYLEILPDKRKSEFNIIHDLIQKTVPNLKPYFASNMIGYGSFYYLDSKKQKKGWPIIALANQKNYISVYVCAIIGDEDRDTVEKLKLELGKLSKGIGCIRFKKIEEINLESLKAVLKLAEKKPGLANARMVSN